MFKGVGASPRVRLVLKEDVPAGMRYLTLSICWGKSMPVRLLQNNITSMLEELPVSRFSQTFRDAIMVTRMMGQRYL
jgi:hypothetical protein